MTLKRDTITAARVLSDDELNLAGGGFNPQLDPPGVYAQPGVNGILIGLLLPAVQKIH